MASLSRKYFASLSLSAESSINFTLLVVALLLLQYSSGFSHFLEGLGRFRSIPHTILFMIVVIACLQLQRPLAYLNRVQSNLLLIGPAFVIWALAALWAYTEGQTLGVLSVDAFAVVSIVSGLVFVLGILTKKDWLCFVGLAILIIVIGEAFIRNNPFDQIFILGRPLWNIRATGLRLMNGGWIYKFNDASSPAYFPFLFLPYLPFTFLGLDLRWANILCVLGIL